MSLFDAMEMGKKDMMGKSDSADMKLKKIAMDIKEVADMMGGGMDEAMEKVQAMCCDQEQDDDADQGNDGKMQAEDAGEAMGGKKAIIVAMLKKKNKDA
jgi:hypothetical protein